MAPKQKMLVQPGDEFGSLTILSEEGRNKHGHLQYLVRCECGKQYIVSRGYLFQKHPRCRECSDKSGYRQKSRPSLYHLWDVVGHRILLTEPEHDEKGLLVAQMMCLSCGNVSTAYPASIATRKGFRCSQCPPEYYFTIKDDIATGILPNGEKFLIDADDLERVSSYYWRIGKEGYVVSGLCDGKFMRLHNFIMNFEPQNKLYVDHINRNRTDCRKCNLRIVTAQQNSMNTSIIRSSATGLRGVTFDKSNKKYIARIGLNDRRIHLGSSVDPIVCAQMYNWAAPIIFGEFTGELNDVPEPPEWIKRKIEEKCKPYALEAMLATQRYEVISAQTGGD